MEYPKEVRKKLGERNVELLLDAVKNGQITPKQMKMIAREMHANVHGEFVQQTNSGHFELIHVIRHLLDRWFTVELHSIEDGKERLINIIQGIEGLGPLATNMKDGSPISDKNQVDNSSIPQDNPATLSSSKPAGKRSALIIANTYIDNTCKLGELPGCKTSGKDVKKKLEARGFETDIETNVSAKALDGTIDEFVKNNDQCEARLLYFCGHGGNEPFKIESDGEFLSKAKDVVQFTGNSGHLEQGGEYVIANDGVKVFKDHILNRFTKDNKPDVHKILIFDCCRGKSDQEMGNSQCQTFQLKISKTEEADQVNVHYKNVILLHSTLPHQVAWVGQSTRFSKQFCSILAKADVNISGMDETINAELGKIPGHIQMVELVKRGISEPFKF